MGNVSPKSSILIGCPFYNRDVLRRFKGFSPRPNSGQASSPQIDGDQAFAAMFDMSPLERRRYLSEHSSKPRFFYKFRAFSSEERLRSQLVRNEIFLSSPRDFNDPFDMRGKVVIKGGIKAFERKLQATPMNSDERREKIKDARDGVKSEGGLQAYVTRKYGPIDQSFEKTIEQCGVYCFASHFASQGKRERLSGPRSNLMWSHYGDSHKGYCLQYSVHTDPVFVKSLEVVYGSEYPVINWLSDRYNDDMHKCLRQKDRCWAYESEWRFIQPGSAKKLLPINPTGIKSILIGAEATPQSIQLVMQMAHERDSLLGVKTNVFQAKRSETQYCLSFTKLK